MSASINRFSCFLVVLFLLGGCDESENVDGPTPPVPVSNRSTVPSSWTCNDSYYGQDSSCDCGCGALDPDCSSSTNVEECYADHCPYGEQLDPYDATRCVPEESCVSTGGACNGGDCCSGSTCVIESETRNTCLQNCTTDSQCSSGCCLDLQGGGGVCGTSNMCAELACRDGGEVCQNTSECCADHTCTRFSDIHVVCAYNCSDGSQCASGCCVPLDGGGSVCGAPEYCGLCAPSGAECSPGDCCAGSACVWIDYVGARCQTQGACPSGCEGNAGNCCRPPYCAGDCVGSPCCS